METLKASMVSTQSPKWPIIHIALYLQKEHTFAARVSTPKYSQTTRESIVQFVHQVSVTSIHEINRKSVTIMGEAKDIKAGEYSL